MLSLQSAAPEGTLGVLLGGKKKTTQTCQEDVLYDLELSAKSSQAGYPGRN